MKKVIASLIAVLALAVAIVPTTTRAKEIKTINASEAGGKISVSGTAEAGTLAVAVMVYDEEGENLITFETAGVSDESLYYFETEIPEGTYVVKVADYDGGNYKIATVSPKTEEKSEEKPLPAAPNSGSTK